MKELILCVILGGVGILVPVVTPESDESAHVTAEESDAKTAAFNTNPKWDADEGPCCQLCYTQWFDRDDPSGSGDYETLVHLKAENPGRICRQPCAIQVQTLAGAEAYTTGQVFQNYDTNTGFACVNAQQPKSKSCLDYKVRFACPC